VPPLLTFLLMMIATDRQTDWPCQCQQSALRNKQLRSVELTAGVFSLTSTRKARFSPLYSKSAIPTLKINHRASCCVFKIVKRNEFNEAGHKLDSTFRSIVHLLLGICCIAISLNRLRHYQNPRSFQPLSIKHT